MKARVGPWWRRILLIAAGVEVAYLILVNAALNLPLTQTLLNEHKPEKYHVYWERAWSWYPFRVHARGISANGQTRSQQWQAEAPSVAASVALLPLLQRSVRIFNVQARDVTYHQRPRPKPGKDYAAIRQYFPPIRDREIGTAAPVRPPRKPGAGWKVIVNDIQATGRHQFWVFQIQAALSGELQADVSYQTRGGPFSLDNGKADVALESLSINKDLTVFRQGTLKGAIEFSPFIPSKNRGLKSLTFMSVDADIGAHLENLDFLSFYLNNLYGMSIDGAGKLTGHVRYAEGYLRPPTDLSIAARELALNALAYKVDGHGDIRVSVSGDTANDANVRILFSDMELTHEKDGKPHLIGKGLEVATRGTTKLLPWEGRKAGIHYAAITVPSVEFPDLGIYQRYLPGKAGVTLNGGQGKFHGQAEVTQTSLTADLQMSSDQADLSLQNYRFKTNLELGINLDIPERGSGKVDVSGTHVRLDEARLIKRQNGRSQPWSAALSLDEGILKLSRPETLGAEADFEQLSQMLKETGFRPWLDEANADFKISGNVSNLEWLNVLFNNPYNMAIAGSGEVAANLHIRSGWPAKGTVLEVLSKPLNVKVLDYLVAGNGLVALVVQKGGKHPDMNLDVDIGDALFRRQEEKEAFIQDVVLKLRAQGKDMTLDGKGRNIDLYLQIPSAKVMDMSVYNQYLPDGSPLRLLGGQADLNAYVHLQPESAMGFVKLNAHDLRSRLNDQKLSGELAVDINLSNGKPANMEFDVSGSSFSLHDVKVVGAETQYDQEGWSAKFDLEKAKAIWRKPVVVEAAAAVEIKDSRPVVAVFSNEKGKHPWLEKLLTVENIRGRADMTLEQDRIVIPYAFVSSDKVDAGAKGIMDADRADGIFYARFRKLDGVLKINNGKRNFDVTGAKRKFGEYSPFNQKYLFQ